MAPPPAPDMSPCGPLNLSLAGEATTCTAPGAPNTSAGPPLGLAGASPALPIFSMTLGAVSNVVVVLAVAGWGSSSLQRPLFLAVRLASWNQILDPWVYILLRQAVLRQLLRLLPSRAGAKGSHGGLGLNKSTWEASSLRSSRHSGLSSF
ncbi:Prostaglandin E2 receptor EP1 subtype [Bos mutus]|uniref:Prostaglandin E2 receptor EP1 subtype n=1 Tax=Bos mutus TaxID=72004 RepID=L8IZC4_9CETA|nr:Prostaglandin E2 receptor EP1 subtype [Bos mutus]